jgi:hypothetical protein
VSDSVVSIGRVMVRLVTVLCGALVVLPPAGALGDVTVTFRPPAGAHVLTSGPSPSEFRTTDPQPTIGVEASAGSQLLCTLQDFSDTEPITRPCGPPMPGCAAPLCGSFRPSTPLAGKPAGQYDLQVEVLDSGGHQIGNSADQGFSVDLTPPTVTLRPAIATRPLKPAFSFDVQDDATTDAPIQDAVSCSFGRVGAPVVWRACPSPTAATYRVAGRHIDYRFGVRGIDDFGRPAYAYREYDPVPCALSVRPPLRLSTIAASGVFLRVRCSYVSSVDVGLWPMAVNGHVYSRTPAGTVKRRPLLGATRLHGHGPHWNRSVRLRMYPRFAAQARHFRSTRFLVTACPADPENPCSDLAFDVRWSYAEFTAHG